ncbi:MAG: DUF6492 family protein [Thermincola sp.]|nr:DUF6492 family protein [Thermincola sp.]MDT3702479.1 DUF6492 family protein [Thermincola sp.]
MNKIDVIIPVIEKDLDVFPYTVDSIRKQVRHPIGEIFVVAPESKKIRELSGAKGCIYVNENSVLPISKADINYSPVRRNISVDRSGWLFQQFLKLGGDTLGDSDGFMVIDADTVLIRPHIFEQNGKMALFCRSLYYRPYFTTYQRLLGENAPGPLQAKFFVSHYMYFNKKRLAELKKVIEMRHDTEWYTAIIKCMSKKQWDSFSEFETYGNFMLKNHPAEIILKPRRNLSCKRTSIKNIAKMNMNQLAQKYGFRSVSFHSWNE